MLLGVIIQGYILDPVLEVILRGFEGREACRNSDFVWEGYQNHENPIDIDPVIPNGNFSPTPNIYVPCVHI